MFKINWGYRHVEKYFSLGKEMSPMVWLFGSGASEPESGQAQWSQNSVTP